MAALLLRGPISTAMIVGVSVRSQRDPRWGALLLLTLPIVGIPAFVMCW